MTILGIDPGLRGGLAWLGDSGELERHERMPVTKLKSRNVADLPALRTMLLGDPCPRMVVVESLQDRGGYGPKISGMAHQSMGRSFGQLEGLTVALGLPVDLASPQVWKPAMLGKDPPANAAAALVGRRCPELVDTLQVKANWGIADAYLIAQWWLEKAPF